MVRAFLGTGLMGSAFVRAMLKRGDHVRVWNRTRSRAEALVDDGAELAQTVGAAVKDIDIVHLSLSDDASVDTVLAAGARYFAPGALIFDHTTTSVAGAVRRTQEWAARDLHYVHAPVLMQPHDVLRGSGVILVSGDRAWIESKALPALQPLTTRVFNVGDIPGQAAGVKLVTNLYLMSVVAGLGDIFSVAKGAGVPMSTVQSVLGAADLTALAINSLNWLQSGELEKNPTWALNTARKDVRLLQAEGAKSGHRLAVLPAITMAMDRWIRNGYGHADWAIFASSSVDQPTDSQTPDVP